jgi:uncharacterized protein YjbI with pentapeptide repeats
MQRLKDAEQRQKEKESKTAPISKLHAFANWFDDWHVTRIFQSLAGFLLILTLIAFATDYQSRKEARIVAAWQLITTEATGNSGKIRALEFLNGINEPLVGIDLSVTDGIGAYLVNVQLPHANLIKTNLRRTILEGVNLEGANLEGANLEGVNLEGANLEGANLFKADLTGARLTGANLTGAYLGGANLEGANLFGANITGAYLGGANLEEANLFEADLEGASLEEANLFGADLTGANLKGASLEEANLFGADLTGAINLFCDELTQAKNWEKSYRDIKLACGASIPTRSEKLGWSA